MSEINEKLLSKLRKILALAQSPNEEEAASAADKVQALLAEHNLSMDDITTDERGHAFVFDATTITESRPWRRQIAVHTAKLYFCEYFFAFHKVMTDTRMCGYIRHDIHNFVGAPHNVAVAKTMFTYLCDTIERLAREGSLLVTSKERTSYMTSFKMSCSIRLCVRLTQRMAESRRGQVVTETGTNLPVLADLYDRTQAQIKEFLDNTPGHATKKKIVRANLNHAKGAADGDEAGDKIGLDAQVKGATTHLIGKS